MRLYFSCLMVGPPLAVHTFSHSQRLATDELVSREIQKSQSLKYFEHLFQREIYVQAQTEYIMYGDAI